MNPFEFVKSINQTKEDLTGDNPEKEKYYESFIVNRSLSYFPDTVAFANIMNQYHFIDKNLQYHFLLNTVRRKSRFSKWEKPNNDDDLNAVKEYYGYSNDKARATMKILSLNDLNEIKRRIRKGGRK